MGDKSAQRFDVSGFTGIVQLKQYAIMPDGKQYLGVAGKVSVIKDTEVIGFEVRGGETANWGCRVEGDNGSVNILGCQVKLVHQFDSPAEIGPDLLDGAYYRVP